MLGGTIVTNHCGKLICTDSNCSTDLTDTNADIIDPIALTEPKWEKIYVVGKEATTLNKQDDRNAFGLKLAKEFEFSFLGTWDGSVNNCPCDAAQPTIQFGQMHQYLVDGDGMYIFCKLNLY